MREQTTERLQTLIHRIDQGELPPLETADELVKLSLDIIRHTGAEDIAAYTSCLWELAYKLAQARLEPGR